MTFIESHTMTDMTPTLPQLGPLPEPHTEQVETYSGIAVNKEVRTPLFTAEQMQSYATAYGEQCARAAVPDGMVLVDRQIIDDAETALGHFCSDLGWSDADMQAMDNLSAVLAATPPAVEARDGWNPAQGMTAHRAIYFMERFKKEEKLLGPNEQAAVDFVIAMLSAAPAAPWPQGVPDPQGDCEWTHCPHRVGDRCCKEPQGVPDGMVLVDRGALKMVINALRRDAEEGRQARGEMADMLATQPPTQQASEQHPDDTAVDTFAAAMKSKLAKAREKGRGGWQEADAGVLSGMLRHHVDKGDPLDVANFCMFLWSLGYGIAKWSGPSELPRHARPKFDRGSFDAAGWVAALADCVKARGVTWKDVAEATGVNETTLSRMKSGDRQPDAASLAALSAWAGINPANYCGPVAAPQQASAQGEQAQQASAQPTQAAKDVLLFLLGEAQLNGYGFGEKPEGVGNYWWRTHLRASFENLLRASNTGQEKS